jgi:hypothetical protein
MPRFILGFLLALALPLGASAQSLPEWSVWKNQRTSLLVVSTIDTTTGDFKGTFINNAKGYKCQGYAVPITGRVTGSDVKFVANFAPCANTITVWKGKLVSNTIVTDWLLKYVDSNDDWQELKDSDTFTQVY